MKNNNKNKKGVSALIATVLLILITIAGVAIIAGAVIPMISRISEGSRTCTNVQLSVNTQSGFTCYDSQNKLLSVMVARGAGEFELSKIAIIIYGADGNSKKIIRNQSLPGVNSASTYVLNTSDFSDISKISVAPIVKNGNREKECDISSTLESIPTCAFALKLTEEEHQPPPPQQNCSDGTLYGQCSYDKPKYCDDGSLINNCGACGCNSGYTCNNTDQSCVLSAIPDTTPPQITIVSPLAQTYSTSKINFNISSNEALSFCKYTINNWITNTTMTSLNTTYYYNITTLSDGNYTAKFWCNDTSGNINNTQQVSFTVDTYTKLLLHMDGTNGSTTFTDITGKIVTVHGTAKVSTDYKKFGTGSGKFAVSGDYLSLADSDDWNLGNGNWTIEAWVNPITLSSGYALVFVQMPYPYYDRFYGQIGSTGKVILAVLNDNTWILSTSTVNNVISAGSWHHIAWVRNGNNLYIFVNGISQTLTVNTTPVTFKDITGTFNIGDSGVDDPSKAYIDEFRLSKGIARWTSNFTVPASPY